MAELDLYTNFKRACKKRGTTITNALRSIGRAEGNTGSWKAGNFPRLDLVIDLAKHLDISLDELVFGDEAKAVVLTSDEEKWLDLLSRIPFEKQEVCYAFLSTHEARPEKYIDKRDA